MAKIISNLSNHFLLATENLDGSFFEGALIYVCAHNEEQTFGLMVNQPMIEVSFNQILESLTDYDIPAKPLRTPDHIFAGGPVENERGFILHTSDYACKSTIEITPDISLTATMDVIEAITQGKGPEYFNFCLGYGGWSPFQLEKEIADSDWLVVPANKKILFQTKPEERFDAAAKDLGLSFGNFSGEIGEA